MNTTLFPLFKPRYWPLWGGIGLLWCLTRLPYRLQLTTGRQLGRILYYFARRRRHIALVNLTLCFPEVDPTQRQTLLYKHFESLGMGLLEMLSAWWQSSAFFQSLWCVEGLEHLHTALAQGKGVILLSAHFNALEMGGRFAVGQTALCAVYRPHENPVIEYFFKRSREKYAEKTIPRDNVREIVRYLKLHKTLWLAMDQNYGHKHSVFANFFGIPAATNTVLSRLAALSNTEIVPFFTLRQHHYHGGYKIIFCPPLQNFPSGNAHHDANQINQLIEMYVRQAPEQYFWVHRRFKDRPPGEENFYDKSVFSK